MSASLRPPSLRILLYIIQPYRKVVSSHLSRKFLFFLCVSLPLFSLIILGVTLSGAQVLGEKPEMDRLEEKAEEAIANGDPNGASLAIGKAALMASMIAKKEIDLQKKQIYVGAEALFRAQENSYRALALFEQAGGQMPAPSGVCQLLGLARQNGNSAAQQLEQQPATTGSDSADLHQRYSAKTQEWIQIIGELQTDFSCL